jgi:uncharacterized protein
MMLPLSTSPTVILCPGNGCTNIRQSNWYGQLYDELQNELKINCICENFPDPYQARRSIWVPFIRSIAERENKHDPSNIILIGHSSGAQAALRYAEQYPVKAVILVSATYSDLNDESERQSGYYPTIDPITKQVIKNPYLFNTMKDNCPVWYQFHSDNDPFIPLHEAEQIRDGLQITDTQFYQMIPDRSHFFEYFSELKQLFDSSLS